MAKLKTEPKSKSKHKYLADPDVLESLVLRLRGPSLQEACPKLAREWHTSKNGTYEPKHFGKGSSFKAWWQRKCAPGVTHVFCSAISARVRAQITGSRFGGCSICSGRMPTASDSLQDAFPDVACQWLEKENAYPTWRLLAGSRRLGLWQCFNVRTVRRKKQVCKTVFMTNVCARTDRKSPQHCPACYIGDRVDLNCVTPKKVKRLFVTAKDNLGFKPEHLPVTYRVFWQCPEKHRWYESFADLQERNYGCPRCRDEDSGTLAQYPDLLSQFHPKLNNGLTSRRISVKGNSERILTWKCNKAADHIWQARLYSRIALGTGCPYCQKRRVTASNSLANFPEIACELDPKVNGKVKPEEILANSTKRYGFVCSDCGWHWQTQMRLRTQRGYGCPKCKRKKN